MLITAILVVTLGCMVVPGWGEPSVSQDGLPAELVIPDDIPLSKQLIIYRELAEAAKQYNPRPSILSGCTQAFSGGDQPRPITAADLNKHATELLNAPVRVEGMYEERGEGGIIRSLGSEVAVVLAGGTVPEGFDATGGVVSGWPVTAQGPVEIENDKPFIRAQLVVPSEALALLRIGRILEMEGAHEDAVKAYEKVAGNQALARGPLGAFARIRAGDIAFDELRNEKLARKHYSAGWQPYTVTDKQGKAIYHTWKPKDDGGWQEVGIREAISGRLHQLSSKLVGYQIVDFFIRLAGGNKAFGVILMAFIVRLCIYPLTRKQLESTRNMQKIQPQIKALQKKHGDDKQAFQAEFWTLCKENNCNPLGGCLPLIVQMPILIFLYRGIRDYIMEFDGTSFLWVQNLSQPDITLLIAYTISMVAFQKMSSMSQPGMDAQQQQQQKMMAYMMPIMFFFLFKTFPAAFILYWLASNVIYIGEHWFSLRKSRDDVGNGGANGPIVVESKPKTGFAGSMLKAIGGKKDEPGETPASYHDKQKQGSKRGKRK
jgi:YidC/Oxa1 family membrane protein insertase